MSFSIKNFKIGNGNKPFVIAELSANHNGSKQRAIDSIHCAKECGADAIKLQTYTAETMTIDCDKEEFLIKGGLWDGYNLFDLYKEAETPYEWFPELYSFADKIDIPIFSTPFDESAVDLLEDLNTPAYKIASFELTDLPLIRYVAKKRKPVIVSTGMSTINEIKESLEVFREEGCNEIALLHCISSYPAPVEKANLKQLQVLADLFDVEVGLSDHTLGITASIASVALGASIIEKHFTIDEKDKGPDSEFSINPKQLKELCKRVDECWKALGDKSFKRQPSEMENLIYRRSIYVVKDVKRGDFLSTENIRRIRPGYGLSPKYYESLIGKKVSCDIERGTALKNEHVCLEE